MVYRVAKDPAVYFSWLICSAWKTQFINWVALNKRYQRLVQKNIPCSNGYTAFLINNFIDNKYKHFIF